MKSPTPEAVKLAKEVVDLSDNLRDKDAALLIDSHTDQLRVENATLREEREWLEFVVNGLRLPLGIDPAVKNTDRAPIIAAFYKAVAALREDKARLDWLYKRANADAVWYHNYRDLWFIRGEQTPYENPRAAIDAARAKEKTP